MIVFRKFFGCLCQNDSAVFDYISVIRNRKRLCNVLFNEEYADVLIFCQMNGYVKDVIYDIRRKSE